MNKAKLIKRYAKLKRSIKMYSQFWDYDFYNRELNRLNILDDLIKKAA